jgi:sacsin
LLPQLLLDTTFPQVLRALGLQCKVTPETFMQLACHIAASAASLAAAAPTAATPAADSCIDVSAAEQSQVDALVSAADALLAYLKSGWAGLGSDKVFWQELGRVQFVPATVGLPGERWCCCAG